MIPLQAFIICLRGLFEPLGLIIYDCIFKKNISSLLSFVLFIFFLLFVESTTGSQIVQQSDESDLTYPGVKKGNIAFK